MLYSRASINKLIIIEGVKEINIIKVKPRAIRAIKAIRLFKRFQVFKGS